MHTSTAQLGKNYINFSNDTDSIQVHNIFFYIAALPRVIGIIDFSHIKMIWLDNDEINVYTEIIYYSDRWK